MSERDPHRWVRFAASTLALLAIGVAVPIGLIASSRSRFGSANPLAGADPPWRWGSGEVGDTLSGPIADDSVIDGIIRLSLCVVWVAVAVIVVTTLVEVIHAVRHHGLAFPDVRGVGWAQPIARFIAIGLVAVLPMASSATSLASTLDARSLPTSTPGASPTELGSTTTPLAQAHVDTPATPAEPTGTVHVVTDGESIYSIAVGLAAGDPARVLGIADAIIDANLGTVMPGGQRFSNPAYIEVGWTLQIPSDVAGPELGVDAVMASGVGDPNATTYTVERGDTLWDIADEQLGDPTAWSEVWERNAGHDMGGGRTFDDPNVILSGWELELADIEPPVAAPVDVEPAAVAEPTETPESQPERIPVEPTFDEPALDEAAPSPSLDRPVANGPLPLTPTTPLESTTSSTSTTVGPAGTPSGSATDLPSADAPAPEAPSPIRLEHAALLAAGVLALVGVRRRQRLRAAMPRHRVPEPRAEVALTERKLRTIDAG